MLLLAFAGLALMIGRAPRAATPTTSRATTVSAKYLDEPLLVPGAVAADPEKMDFFSQWFPLTSTRTLAVSPTNPSVARTGARASCASPPANSRLSSRSLGSRATSCSAPL